MQDVAFYKPHPQLVSDQKNHMHPIGNKIDPCGKVFSHAGSFLVMREAF